MNLLPVQRPMTGRRLGGLAISVPLHLALLLVAARTVLTPLEHEQPDVEITYVSLSSKPGEAPRVTARDPMLLEQNDLFKDPALTEPSLALPDFDFDVSKISARRNVLFPFVTDQMTFLQNMTREVSVRRGRVVNPFSSSAPPAATSKPPLVLTASALDRVVDRAWSRRDRWSRFSEIARLVQEHDTDDGRAADLVQAYRDRNILQPICDYRIVTGPPRRETVIMDHMLWMMLEIAADHAEFVDFAHAFAREHPSSRTTTELLFIVDKLVQGNRDALLSVLNARVEHLSLTASLMLSIGASEGIRSGRQQSAFVPSVNSLESGKDSVARRHPASARSRRGCEPVSAD